MKNYLIWAVALCSGLAVTAGNAADMAVKAPAKPIYKAPVADPYNWTGGYVGANVGYSWGKSDTSAIYYNNTTGAFLYNAGSKSFDMDGWLGGLQVGYNWQVKNVVLGIEADIQWTGQKGSTAFTCPGPVCNLGNTGIPAANAPVNASLDQKLSWFATLRPRLGFTVTPTVLAYATGGLAVGHIKTDGTLSGYTSAGAATSSSFSDSKTKAGWTVGGGVEAKLWGKWTGKIEYLYVDLGSVDTTGTLTTNHIPIRAEFSSKITDNILRAGLNYHF